MLVDILQAVVLGLVQGLAEFIPISSSGHLVLVPALFGIEPGGLPFDVALHVGTMFAVIVYLRRELLAIAMALVGRDRSPRALVYRRLGLYALAATVPVGVLGLALEEQFTRVFATPVVAAVMLLATGTLLLFGEWMRDRRIARATTSPHGAPTAAATPAPAAPEDEGARAPSGGGGTAGDVDVLTARPRSTGGSVELPLAADATDPSGLDLGRMGLREALIVGVAQCLALLPGISRSGTTIVAGMSSGLTREAATRFSFLLSLPALAGAAVVSLGDLTGGTAVYPPPAIVAGVLAAFCSGYLAIRVLIALVARDRLTGFAIYCYLAGTASLVALAVSG